MKKIFLFVLMLFAFVACSSTQFIHDAKPITKDEKTVLIQYFPTDFEIDLEKALENNFWKVSVVSNKDTSSPSLKSNFAITCESLYLYKFKVATKSGIIENIIKTMESIPGAATYTNSTTVTKPAVQ